MNRQEEIHSKGFNFRNLDFNKIKVGVKTLDDATMNLGALKVTNKAYGDKSTVLKAISDRDTATMIEISKYFYRTSGIYARACNYFANLYRYDWYVVPEIYKTNVKNDKIVEEFNHLLNCLDNSYIKKLCMEIALSVIINGAYYGYAIPNKNGIVL